MGISVWPPNASGTGTTSLTPFTGPVLTVPHAKNQIEPTGIVTSVAPNNASTFVTSNPIAGGNSYATATVHMRGNQTGCLAVLDGSDDAQATWFSMGGINALTGRYEAALAPPDNGVGAWYVAVAGISIIRLRVVALGGGGLFVAWTGSAAGVISPPPAFEGVKTLDPASSVVLYAQNIALGSNGAEANYALNAGWRDGALIGAGTGFGQLGSWYTPSAFKSLYLDAVLAELVSGNVATNVSLKIRSSLTTGVAPTNILMPIQLAPPLGTAATNQGMPAVSLNFPRSIRIPAGGTLGISASYLPLSATPATMNVALICHEV